MVNLVARRREMLGRAARLPKEYQEVEYIESTGTQYIDLPFGFDADDEVEFCMCVDRPSSSDYVNDKYMVSPIRWNTNNNRFAMGLHSFDSIVNTYNVGFGSFATNRTPLVPRTSTDWELHEWVYKNRNFSIKGTEYSLNVSGISFGSTTANLRLFYGYNSNTVGKIAYYRHYKNNVIICNLIPCYRKSDGEIGMYDAVSKTFYTNAGTGTFLKGADV